MKRAFFIIGLFALLLTSCEKIIQKKSVPQFYYIENGELKVTEDNGNSNTQDSCFTKTDSTGTEAIPSADNE